MGRIHQISISAGGVPKTPVDRARVTADGVEGDFQRDRVNHGGQDRALCLFSLEVIEGFKREGHPIEPGYAGENLTISGLDWITVVPGSRLRVGDELEIEVTKYTAPCANNAPWFLGGDFTRMMQRRHPGESRLYARVLKPGLVQTGDEVALLP